MPQSMPGDSFYATNPDAWLAAIVDSSDDAIVGKTLDGTIRSWNAGAMRIFRYEPSEIIGRSVLELIPPDRRHEETMIIDRLSRGLRVEHFDTVRLRSDGSLVEVSLSVSPIRDKAGRIVGAAKIARDVTEQNSLRRAEHELAQQLEETAAELEQQVEEAQSLQEELEQANEGLAGMLGQAERARSDADAARQVAEDANAAKGRFLATMSHELRTPLNAIAGYVELLEMGLRGPVTPDQQLDLARIKRSQETLLRLIDDVLSFAKLESGRVEYDFEQICLDDLLATLEIFVAPRMSQKGLRYTVQSCGPNVVASLDRAKVEQILLNLLSNAVKFTEHGGIHVTCSADDDTVRIQVRDTGRGIRPEFLETIFDPFVQGDRSLTRTAEGTGLGLSISRQLGRGMGGDVTVESAVGEGSTFTLVLPRRCESA